MALVPCTRCPPISHGDRLERRCQVSKRIAATKKEMGSGNHKNEKSKLIASQYMTRGYHSGEYENCCSGGYDALGGLVGGYQRFGGTLLICLLYLLFYPRVSCSTYLSIFCILLPGYTSSHTRRRYDYSSYLPSLGSQLSREHAALHCTEPEVASNVMR
jgi:hypothetical protein